MLTQRVCFVLGAGASVPYGFPSGGGLLNFAVQGPPDEWWPLVNDAYGIGKPFHETYIETLLDSGAESLDDFAGSVVGFKEYTKALIAYRIGRSEVRANLTRANKDQDWLRFFINRLGAGLEFGHLANKQLDVVTFNFDRSFEEALLVRLSTRYGKSRSEIAKSITHWNFIHVHGSLGQLTEFAQDDAGRPYGITLDPEQLKLAVGNIMLLDDAQKDSKEFQRSQELIKQADLVFFLGFGFHRLNCERVIPQQWPAERGPLMISATMYEMTHGATQKASKYFTTGPGLTPFNGRCLSFLMQYEHLFSD